MAGPELIQMLVVVKDVVTTLAVGTGGYVAVVGLRAWKKQLRGRTEYDLAKSLLRAVLKIRDEIAYVRSPLILSGEIEAAIEESESGLSPEDRQAAELARLRRWRHLSSAMSDLEVEALEAEVLWGPRIQTRLAGLRKTVRELQANVWEYGFLRHADLPLQDHETERLATLRPLVQ